MHMLRLALASLLSSCVLDTATWHTASSALWHAHTCVHANVGYTEVLKVRDQESCHFLVYFMIIAFLIEVKLAYPKLTILK